MIVSWVIAYLIWVILLGIGGFYLWDFYYALNIQLET